MAKNEVRRTITIQAIRAHYRISLNVLFSVYGDLATATRHELFGSRSPSKLASGMPRHTNRKLEKSYFDTGTPYYPHGPAGSLVKQTHLLVIGN